MKTEILKLLKETDDYISGQELCEKFGVSRTAIWKAVNALKEEGYEIDAVKNKGYKIVAYPDIITFNELKTTIDTKWAGRDIYYYDTIDSTNNKAKFLAEEGAANGTLVVSDIQTGGRGRRGRKWESPSGTGIWMTLILKPEIEIANASMLTIVMAIAVADAIKEYSGLEGMIKWPNDIVINGKKICGILTEMSIEMDHINHIVVGVGINVNTRNFPKELEDRATSMALEGGKNYKRAQLIKLVMQHFEEEFEVFIKTQSLKDQITKYNQMLVNVDEQVMVCEPNCEYKGTARGINEKGELLVEKENGEKVYVYAGEVSVRGIYGYV